MSPSATRRWFPGYTVVGASAVALVLTAPGQTFILSQLNVPLTEELGLTPLSVNMAYTVATVASALPLVWVGRFVDKVGPRRALAAIACAAGLGCVLMASARGLLSVLAGFFALRFLSQGALALASQHAIAMWFHRRLGRVSGIKLVLVFATWAPLPFATTWLISSLGWRTTYVLFGVVVASVMVPVALGLVVNRPEDVGLQMDDEQVSAQDAASSSVPAPAPTSRDTSFTLEEALRSRAFWVIAAVFFLTPLIGTAILFDLQPMLLGRGLSVTDAALPITAWTITMALMALPAGALTDRVQPRTLMALATGFIATSAFVLSGASSLALACVSLVCFGVGQSIAASAGNAALARFYGRAHHGAIRASISRLGVIGTGLGPILIGAGATFAGGYRTPLLAFSAACVPVAILSWTLAVPAIRRADVVQTRDRGLGPD